MRMNTLSYRELFEYNHQMNQKLIRVFEENSDRIPEQSLKWLSHVLNAQQIWNNRINPGERSYSVWQLHAIGSLKGIDARNHEASCHILDHVDLDKQISYTTSRGDSFENTVKDILFHMINHSTYHRGQVATDLKRNNIEPPVTDYIFYKR